MPTIGQAYREIKKAKAKAQAEIQKKRKDHPLVARPTANSDYNHDKTRRRQGQIHHKIISYEEKGQDLLKKAIMDSKKVKNPKKQVIIHGKDDKPKDHISQTDSSEPYADHSSKYET